MCLKGFKKYLKLYIILSDNNNVDLRKKISSITLQGEQDTDSYNNVYTNLCVFSLSQLILNNVFILFTFVNCLK